MTENDRNLDDYYFEEDVKDDDDIFAHLQDDPIKQERSRGEQLQDGFEDEIRSTSTSSITQHQTQDGLEYFLGFSANGGDLKVQNWLA